MTTYLECPCCYESHKGVDVVPQGQPDPDCGCEEECDCGPVWWNDQKATCPECGCLVGVDCDGETASAIVLTGCAVHEGSETP